MTKCNQGLRVIYNRFHDKDEVATEVKELREQHVAIDVELLSLYGWGDIQLCHDFRKFKRDQRFLISELARNEIVMRLSKLNKVLSDEDCTSKPTTNPQKPNTEESLLF